MFDATNVVAWTKELNGLSEAASASLGRGEGDSGLSELRAFYRTILASYPSSVATFLPWDNPYEELERLFSLALKPYGDVRMWRLYLQYVRMGCLEGGDGPDAVLAQRQTLSKAYERALSSVGVDLHSLSIYSDYIAFIRSWPTGNMYEQQQQMDAVRKVYHRALTTPLDGIETLWHEYDAWENALNKLTAAKVLADRSPVYMTARATARDLKDMLSQLNRDEYALPPRDDADQAARKCWMWQRWVEWEKRNPVALSEKSPLLHSRIQYAYQQMLGVLRHYGEVWFDYAGWLKLTGRQEEAESLLAEAVMIFPQDPLLVFAYADHLEELTEQGDLAEDRQIHYREKARGAYEAFIALLEKPDVALDNSPLSNDSSIESPPSAPLTLAYIQYMNYCRRSDGIAAARAVFTRARKSSQTTFHLFAAAAQMEYHFKKDPIVAGRIYELGMSRFARNGDYVAAYLRHLLLINDEQNARALFERAIATLPANEGLVEIWKCYLDHVFCYGDAASIRDLKRRFQEAFPDHAVSKDITMFCRRYSCGEELTVGSDRIWTLLQLSTAASAPPPPVERRFPEPFSVPERLMDWIARLPLHYDGPSVNVELLLSLLMTDHRIPDSSSLTMNVKATLSSASGRAALTKRPSERGRKRRQHRLDDGEASREAAQAPQRPDDLFAARRTRI